MSQSLKFALEPHYYTQAAIFEQETEKIFLKNWQMVGHRSQVANHGDYMSFEVFRENIFVTNSHGDLKAFYNVCPHRAHELVEGKGNKKAIVCPYHAWVFSTAGELLTARGADQLEGFDKNQFCLTEVRLEVCCNFIFINLNKDAKPMREVYPEVSEGIYKLAPNIDNLVLSYQHTKSVNANWKVTVENYNECYHCPNVHTAFSQSVVDPESYTITPRNNVLFHAAFCHTDDKQAYEVAEGEESYGSYFLWPTTSIQIYPGSVVNTYHWIPVSATETLIYRSWFFETATPTDEQMKIIELDRTTTFDEDIYLVNSVQRGLNSRGYKPGPIVMNPEGFATTMSENATFAIKELVLNALERVED